VIQGSEGPLDEARWSEDRVLDLLIERAASGEALEPRRLGVTAIGLLARVGPAGVEGGYPWREKLALSPGMRELLDDLLAEDARARFPAPEALIERVVGVQQDPRGAGETHLHLQQLDPGSPMARRMRLRIILTGALLASLVMALGLAIDALMR